jgi:hypothetical protein
MKCYTCGVEITDENRSEEHVINNALGGHLTSDDLLCKPCNDASRMVLMRTSKVK